MTYYRVVTRVVKGSPTMEGAGVHLKRLFGFGAETDFDPFLLMDHFGSDRPEQYIAGFPWHPHRGIETITYVLEGMVEHMDSLGNSGIISSGDIQWMTAGSGIVHQEMPKGDTAGRMSGFQLWSNLPKADKMISPKYREIKAGKIPHVLLDDGTSVGIIAGTYQGVVGPVDDIVSHPIYFDVDLPTSGCFRHLIPSGHTTLAYVFKGEVYFGNGEGAEKVSAENLAVLSDAGDVAATASASGGRFILFSGKPLREPVAWRGPIVMNTEEELRIAFEEYRNGTFIK